ncbi:unnamed protein product, partial [Iphiclides podalirius]
MDLTKLLCEKFINWKPPAPEVFNRSRDTITLDWQLGAPFGFLGNQLLYKVEKREKIPPWVIVYSEATGRQWFESQWSEETWSSTDSDGTSAVCFCMAVRCGYVKQAQDVNGLHVEHYAVDSCKLEVLKHILDKGGDVKVQDGNGWTPLFRAICQGAVSGVIEELILRGSSVDMTDHAGLSLVAAARLLKDKNGRRRDSVLRQVDATFIHEKALAHFSRLTKKISSVQALLK